MAKNTGPTKHGRFDRRVRLRPGIDNRQEALDRIMWGLRDRGMLQSNVEIDLDYIRRFLDAAPRREKGVLAPVVPMFGLAFEYAMGGVLSCLDRHPRCWEQVAMALNYSRIGMAVDRARRLAECATYEDPSSPLADTPAFLWLLAVACCQSEPIRPWSHYLYNLVSMRGLDDDFGDGPMFEFLWLMLRADCEGIWPEPSECGSSLEALGPLLTEVDNPKSFSHALMSFLDYRLSRAYQFRDTKARKAEPGAYFLFHRQWKAILPAELLALKALAKRVRGIDLNLEVDHPLAQTPLLQPPRFEQLPSDPLLDEIVKASREYFGDLWQPDEVVPLIRREVQH